MLVRRFCNPDPRGNGAGRSIRDTINSDLHLIFLLDVSLSHGKAAES
ncbi:hypothetical protein [Enterobacter roggenkampii]|nr:hypothetical protein [Enterobacter roggenkampii]